jgi:hypothetical protein
VNRRVYTLTDHPLAAQASSLFILILIIKIRIKSAGDPKGQQNLFLNKDKMLLLL